MRKAFGFHISFTYDGIDDMTLEELKAFLVKKEKEQDFETCSRIRDRIKELENRSTSKDGNHI